MVLPVQLLLILVMMYCIVGLAFLAGVCIMLALIFVNYQLDRERARHRTQLGAVKEQRTAETSQFFSKMRFVKINALEEFVFARLARIRAKESLILRARLKIEVLIVFSLWAAPSLINLAVFAIMTARAEAFRPFVVFSLVSLSQLLQVVIRNVPIQLSEMLEAYAALGRVQKFLALDEVSTSFIRRNQNPHDGAVIIRHGYFSTQRQRATTAFGEESTPSHADLEINLSQTQSVIKKNLLDQAEPSERAQPSEFEKVQRQCLLKNVNLTIPHGAFCGVIGQ